MSTTAAAPHPQDRSLVRRFNFLGLPSEREDGALTFSELRADLGESNAQALVTRLGELVKVHHLDQLGVPLDRAVDHILQSLTPQERRSVAAGEAVPPRVEALITAEADAAKMQRLAENIHGPTTNDAARAGLGIGGIWAGRGAGGSSGGSASASADSRRSYSELPGGWTTEKLQRLASDLGVPWAANNPGLLRLGPAAIQVLADVHLREESYKRFHEVIGLNDKDIVAGARYAKKHDVDYNETSKTAAEIYKGLTPTERHLFRRGMQDLYNAKAGKEDDAREKFNKVMDGLGSNHPGMHDGLEKLKRDLKTERAGERAADAKIDTVFGAAPTAPPTTPKGKASLALAPK